MEVTTDAKSPFGGDSVDSSSQEKAVKHADPGDREDRKTAEASLTSLRQSYWLGLGLHTLLVLVHVVLIAIIYAGHLENRISVSLGRPANIASVAIVVVSQVINQVFLVALVLIVQQLALRRTLHQRQTLTAVHDQYDAWKGFGAACSTLLKQYHLPVSVWSVLAVTGYLLCVSVLHVTVPATFSLATFNKSIPGTVDLKSNIPNLQGGGVHVALDDAATFLPMMATLSNTNTTIGLHSNVLFNTVYTTTENTWPYDSLPIFEDFDVPATIFHVDCGLVDNGVVQQNGTGANGVWNITSKLMGQSPSDPLLFGGINNPIKLLAPYAIRFLPLNIEDPAQPTAAGQTALFYASVNITDDQGRNGTRLDLDPPMGLTEDESIERVPLTWSPTVVACNLRTEVRNITLDAHSRNISSSVKLNRTVRTTWQQWEQPEKSNDTLVLSWGSIFNINTRTVVPATVCEDPWAYLEITNLTCTYDQYLTVPEKFLNDYLNLRIASRSLEVGTSATLEKLELALEDMTAAVYWSAANYVENSNLLDGYNFYSSSALSTLDVQLYNPAAQLNLNITPLLVGFAASLVLLFLFFWIIRTPENHTTLHSEMTMTGFLQLMWLLGRGSSAQEKIAEVQFPSADNLRKAAKFEVCMDTLVRHGNVSTMRSRTWGGGDDEHLELTALDHTRTQDEEV